METGISLPAPLMSLAEQSLANWQAAADASPLTTTQRQQALRAFGLSDFITEACRREPALLPALLEGWSLSAALSELDDLLASCGAEADLHRQLRQFRRRQMARIAWRDLLGLAPLAQTLAELSELADALIRHTLQWLEADLQQSQGVPVDSQGQPQSLYVLAMGKLGGGELNFSSDIDLIFAFPEHGQTTGGRRKVENQRYFTRLAQRLIAALNQTTADGFVYRVDMRLRPFGDSGPLVMNFAALEDYYQEQGRDWERYAMLKARVLGGDPSGRASLETLLRPFVYRRYIDFSAIEALRRMKHLISQEVRRRNLSDNLKLGAGGIRELEFVVQALQLIHGGRRRALQLRSWQQALETLVTEGLIEQRNADQLLQAYHFLRLSENRLQAINDQQTQTLPDNPRDRLRLASAMGFADWDSYRTRLDEHLAEAHEAFRQVIGEAPAQVDSAAEFIPLWQSELTDEEATATLADLGFSLDAAGLWQALQQFRADYLRRSIGGRGRQRLNDLVPVLLASLAEQAPTEPGEVLERVLGVVRQILTRTTYLELLLEHPGVRSQLIKLCARSRWIAQQLASYPMILDELLDPSSLYQVPTRQEKADQLRQWMLRVSPDDLEQQMEALRQFKLAHQLRIAAADVTGVLPVMRVSDQLTWLAEAILEEVVNLAWHQISQRHGAPAGTSAEEPGFLIVGYGKLGGIELGYGSDLDVVFLHQDQPSNTDGPRPLDGRMFYVRLAQRILHLLGTRTPSGILYEVDTRLRPSGNAGMLVITLGGFTDYQQQEAWTWEHQALVRSRPVAGSPALAQAFEQCRQQILALPRAGDKLAEDVRTMRQKMRDNLSKDTSALFDLKQGRGGIADIEFMVQYLVLNHSHPQPKMAYWSDNVRILETTARLGLLPADDCERLTEAYCQLRDTGHHQVLQGGNSVVPAEGWETLREAVTAIWRTLLGSQ